MEKTGTPVMIFLGWIDFADRIMIRLNLQVKKAAERLAE